MWIGHSVRVMKGHYLCLSDSDFAEAVADLESPIPHATPHAIPTDSDGLGQPRTDSSIGKTS